MDENYCNDLSEFVERLKNISNCTNEEAIDYKNIGRIDIRLSINNTYIKSSEKYLKYKELYIKRCKQPIKTRINKTFESIISRRN